MSDDFTEDFEDDLPEEFQEEAPKPAPARRPAPAPAPRAPARPAPQQQRVQAPASAPVQTQQVRYVPFELPSRIGIFDNTTGKPMMEESPKDKSELSALTAKVDVLFGAIVELMNKVTELEKDI